MKAIHFRTREKVKLIKLLPADALRLTREFNKASLVYGYEMHRKHLIADSDPTENEISYYVLIFIYYLSLESLARLVCVNTVYILYAKAHQHNYYTQPNTCVSQNMR